MCIALQLSSDVEQPWLIGNMKSEDLPISKETLAERSRKLRLMNKKRHDSGRPTKLRLHGKQNEIWRRSTTYDITTTAADEVILL